MPFDGKTDRVGMPGSQYSERLRELARVLEGVEESKFDLRDWSRGGRCDSIACAVGWAMRDDWFQQNGFVWRDKGPYFEGLSHWKAVRAFFGLSREEAFDLFHVGRYENATRDAVSGRVKAMAARR